MTVEGKLLHKRVDDPFFTEIRNSVIIARSVPVTSYRLGFSGICDVVEFTESPQGVKLPGRQVCYLPAPVEYKRGKPKKGPSDEAQLCAQAICLEEMLAVTIPRGFLYYGETRHREEVLLSTDLRALVENMAGEMHNYFQRGFTPRVKTSKACRSCSLADVCLPELQEKTQRASQYIRQQLEKDSS